MFKHYFEGISGIEIYPVVLLVIFLLFFVSMSVWMIRTNNLNLKKQSMMPLDENAEQQSASN
jgi:cytochrome c oxidase cbb3-type subunit 4